MSASTTHQLPSDTYRFLIHTLRLTLPPRSSRALKCRAQANSMMRQSQSALRLLLRMQAARQKLEADNEARDRGAWTEHSAMNLMAEALSPQPPPTALADPPPPPEPAEPPPSPCGPLREGGWGRGPSQRSTIPARTTRPSPHKGPVPSPETIRKP